MATANNMAHHKQWYGNEAIQELLAGPFYGFGLASPERAVIIDHGIRMAGQFCVRYQHKYIVCAGPRILDILHNTLSEEELKAPMYQSDTLAGCIAEIFVGEGLTIDSGRRGPVAEEDT